MLARINALLIMAMTLTAQATDVGLAGSSGWAGVGLLGLVMSWLLLVHLPAKDKQLEALMDRHDKAVAALRVHHELSEKELRDTFTDSLKEIVQHCKDEMATVLSKHQ